MKIRLRNQISNNQDSYGDSLGLVTRNHNSLLIG